MKFREQCYKEQCHGAEKDVWRTNLMENNVSKADRVHWHFLPKFGASGENTRYRPRLLAKVLSMHHV